MDRRGRPARPVRPRIGREGPGGGDPLDQVPKAVMDAAKSKFPGATIKEASKETEDGKKTFELEMSLNNRNVDASFEANGTLVAVESQVGEDEVPAASA